jgi:hypothetical protein
MWAACECSEISVAAEPFRAGDQDQRSDHGRRDEDHRHVDEQGVRREVAVDGGDLDPERDETKEGEQREDELCTSPVDARPPRRGGVLSAHCGDLQDKP